MSVERSSSRSPSGQPQGNQSDVRGSWGGQAPVRGSRTWPGWVGLAALLGLPLVSALAVVLWVQGDPSDEQVVAVETEMSHVHGLGTNPADGVTYVATHSGVFRLAEGADPVRVADRYQDTMGFTVTGSNRFLASGHPDLTDESLPTHLGLIESTDAAETWQQLSLGGEADLHAVDTGPGGIVAFDALSGRLLSSEDGRKWTVVAEGAVLDVATNPSDAASVLVTTPDGELLSYDLERGSEVLRDAPPVGLIDWPEDDLLVAAGVDGQLYRSNDGGESFEAVGEPLGTTQAIDMSEGAWVVATKTGVLRSTDEGETWQTLVEFAQ